MPGDTPPFPVPGALSRAVTRVHDSPVTALAGAGAGVGVGVGVGVGAPEPVAAPAPVPVPVPVPVGVVTVCVFLNPEEEGPFPGRPPPLFLGDTELVVPLEGDLGETAAAMGSLWITEAMAGEDADSEGVDWDCGTEDPEWNAQRKIPFPDRAGFYTEGVKLVHALLRGLQLSLAHPSIKVFAFSDDEEPYLRKNWPSDTSEASVKEALEANDTFFEDKSRNMFPVHVFWRNLTELTVPLLGLPAHVQQVVAARAQGRALATSTVIVFFEEDDS